MVRRLFSRFIDSQDSNDIFGVFRDYFHTDNPHIDGYITINASSTFFESDDEEFYRIGVSTLICKPDNYRWVSNPVQGSYFTIDFHSNAIDLRYYRIFIHPEVRYPMNWAVYGIKGSQEYFIDSQSNFSFCNTTTCPTSQNATFRCSSPGVFNKFKVISTGPDSQGEDFFSMSAIEFFGVINPHLTCQSHRPYLKLSLFAYVFFEIKLDK